MLTACKSPRGYLKDLSSGSSAVQLINEEFGRRAHDMPIYTFFETGEMRLGGILSEIVVPRDAAVLGALSPWTLSIDINLFLTRTGLQERANTVSKRRPQDHGQISASKRRQLP